MSEKKQNKRGEGRKKNLKEEKGEEIINKIEENIEKSEEAEEKRPVDKKVLLAENKTFLIIMGVLLLIISAFVSYFIFSHSAKNFSFRGVQYTITPMGKITFYNTKVPTVYNGKIAEYNLYLRNNPRTLESEVPFNGVLFLRPYIDPNFSNSIDCNGDGAISIQNMINLYQGALNTTIIEDPHATCDPQVRYVFVNIQPSNRTDIEQTAPGCYNINVDNCEVLKATERYMTETLALLKEINYSA